MSTIQKLKSIEKLFKIPGNVNKLKFKIEKLLRI